MVTARGVAEGPRHRGATSVPQVSPVTPSWTQGLGGGRPGPAPDSALPRAPAPPASSASAVPRGGHQRALHPLLADGRSPPHPTAVPRRRLTALGCHGDRQMRAAGLGIRLARGRAHLPERRARAPGSIKGSARHGARPWRRGRRSAGGARAAPLAPGGSRPATRPATCPGAGVGTEQRGQPAPASEQPGAAREARPAASPAAAPELTERNFYPRSWARRRGAEPPLPPATAPPGPDASGNRRGGRGLRLPPPRPPRRRLASGRKRGQRRGRGPGRWPRSWRWAPSCPVARWPSSTSTTST